jgi:hypothetical protein
LLENDDNGVLVITKYDSVFPKGTIATIVSCEFVGFTSTRAYCIQTDSDLVGFVTGLKTAWYLERDLSNFDI